MKNKIKLTEKYLQERGIDDIDLTTVEEAIIKRITTNEEIVIEENEEKTMVGYITTPDIDYDGDVVMPDAFDLKRYSRNPIVLFNHNLNLPIAKSTEMVVKQNGIMAKTVFGSTPFANDIWTLVKDGILKTFSIGFRPMKSLKKGTEEFNKKFAELKMHYPNKFSDKMLDNLFRIITKAELLEYSVVTIPSDSEAYATAISTKGIHLDNETLKELKINEEVETVEHVEEPVIEKQIETVEPIEPIVNYSVLPKYKIIGHEPIKTNYKIIGHDNSDEINLAIRLAKGRLD